MKLKEEAEQLLDDINACKGIFTDDHETWKLKLILASFERVSREAAEQCYKKHRISKVNYDKIAKKYFYTWFNKYWKSITNK